MVLVGVTDEGFAFFDYVVSVTCPCKDGHKAGVTLGEVVDDSFLGTAFDVKFRAMGAAIGAFGSAFFAVLGLPERNE